ncbi:hypothetical protein GUJ93_ZPchr0008g13836 [Zizania palustris]|uniref:Uroporphyrinogen decarboxylase (URO-D) domain-containing protein n=1 Tax=Zizania palustris TaxID=103762 RepID=A0A8J5UVI9_ZIZPA|nr:hypothetical protein GUJ93_ZPchr0008g13836 [Zizania palustris]
MTNTYTNIKSMCHTAPNVLRGLLSHLAEAISDYIIYQVNSGAQCIQIFDSWGGQLPPHVWEQWSKPYIKQIVNKINIKCPHVPLVLYINGNGGLLERMTDTGVDVIVLTDEIHRVVKSAGPKGHILNLGHGVLVKTPEEAVAHFFDVTRSLRYDTLFPALFIHPSKKEKKKHVMWVYKESQDKLGFSLPSLHSVMYCTR